MNIMVLNYRDANFTCRIDILDIRQICQKRDKSIGNLPKLVKNYRN